MSGQVLFKLISFLHQCLVVVLSDSEPSQKHFKDSISSSMCLKSGESARTTHLGDSGLERGKTTEISTHFKDNSLDDMNRDAMDSKIIREKAIKHNTKIFNKGFGRFKFSLWWKTFDIWYCFFSGETEKIVPSNSLASFADMPTNLKSSELRKAYVQAQSKLDAWLHFIHVHYFSFSTTALICIKSIAFGSTLCTVFAKTLSDWRECL